ncbi:hypothetical protein VTN49DRAFT_6947 [Thermomyces lanuginosus]|uniref:uncharacterized protein n=1 Tax=Thermomyces lanuginosus TaxID=5541 RepID=UPI00374350EA
MSITRNFVPAVLAVGAGVMGGYYTFQPAFKQLQIEKEQQNANQRQDALPTSKQTKSDAPPDTKAYASAGTPIPPIMSVAAESPADVTPREVPADVTPPNAPRAYWKRWLSSFGRTSEKLAQPFREEQQRSPEKEE